jgi:predicted GIY-YIG superfamily endonuclease
MGTVYLLHFSKPYKHAQHYIGYTDNLDKRLERHRKGNGARLIEVISKVGIEFCVARTWEGDRKLERKLKNYKKSSQLCPICKREKDGKKKEHSHKREK